MGNSICIGLRIKCFCSEISTENLYSTITVDYSKELTVANARK